MTDESKTHDAAPAPAGTETPLGEALAKLRELFDNIPNIMFSLDLEYRITEISRVGPGLTKETVLGRHAADFIFPEERARTLSSWDRARDTGETVFYETSGPGMDGAMLHYISAVCPLRRAGQVAGVVVSTMDITTRKHLEETTQAAIARAEAAALELAEKNSELEREMAERAQTEMALQAQREALRALSTPILKLWDGVVALPVIGVIDSVRAAQMMERLLDEIVQSGARFAILDLTGVEMVDTSTASYLLNLVRAAGLLGSRCLVSGIAPTVAQTMVHLEVALSTIQTFGTLQDALRFAISASSLPAARGVGNSKAAGGRPRGP